MPFATQLPCNHCTPLATCIPLAMPFATQPSTILAIDTALERLSLALQHQGKLVGQVYENCGPRSNERMFGALEALFHQAGLRPQQVNLLATTLGPGSFTGVRIGMAAALSYAQLGAVPVVGIDTMRLLAAQVSPSFDSRFYVLLNCVRQEVHVASYQWRAGQLQRLDAIRLLLLPEALEEIRTFPVLLHSLSYGRIEGLHQSAPKLRQPTPNASLLIEQGIDAQHGAHSSVPANDTGVGFKPLAPLYFQSAVWRKWQPSKHG